jgi:hypothetical protein
MTDQRVNESVDWFYVKETASKGACLHRCVLELQERIAALEAAQANQFRGATEKATSAEAQPAGSLVERVGTRAGGDARAAIREVAAWIRSELNGRSVADRLEQEANQ